MSEPKRYHNTWAGALGYTVVPHPAGEFVSWEDYARLKAEVERLTADNEQLQNRCDFLEGNQS